MGIVNASMALVADAETEDAGLGTKAQRNAEYERQLGRHWEVHDPEVGAPRFLRNSQGDREVVCGGCGYRAAPCTFYKLHAEPFCRLYRGSTVVHTTLLLQHPPAPTHTTLLLPHHP